MLYSTCNCVLTVQYVLHLYMYMNILNFLITRNIYSCIFCFKIPVYGVLIYYLSFSQRFKNIFTFW